MNGPAWGRWPMFLLLASLLIQGGLGVGGVKPASAQTNEELSCYSGKLAATGTHAKLVGKCHAGLAKGKGLAVFDTCLDGAQAKIQKRIDSTNAKTAKTGFDCPGDVSTLALEDPGSWQANLVDTAIFQANPLPAKCVQKRATALAKYANKYTRCAQRGFGQTPSEFATCAASSVAAFSKSWTKAANSGACTSDDFDTTRQAVDAAILAQVAVLHVTCGDGIQGGFEDCDDGNSVPLDGCENDCTLSLRCGNGITQPENDEECDDGNEDDGDGCDSECIVETCGNGKVQSGESCDDGGESATCDDDCTPVSCGDGNANETAGEGCDTAGASASCDADCTVAVCGDGTFNAAAGEQCDTSGESLTCDADCTLASCGDGTTNATRGEQCDTSGESMTCDADCTLASCGDGTTNATRGEQCDAAGESAGCDTDCTLASCGDGTTNATAGEQCDTSGQSINCDADCTVAVCGDGTVNSARGETCDDAGESMTCDVDCTAAVCGDGAVNATRGEQCDTSGQSASCDPDCSLAQCGDSYVNASAGEACDTGGESMTCDGDCTAPVCGDTVLNEAAGEECDDGDVDPNDGCDAICHLESCGDGDRQESEECDDGNMVDGDGCSDACLRETCGTVGMSVECLYCPEGSEPNATYTACQCKSGYQTVGMNCIDIDECGLDIDGCAPANPCVNTPGSYSCSIDCTQAAFHAALTSCGAPSGTITFNCTDTTIPITDTGNGPRQNSCNGLIVDGLDRNITFELDPICYGRVMSQGSCQTTLNPDGTCDCPDVESGTLFMALNGNDMTVRNLTLHGFFDGVKTGGNNNTVENMEFQRVCDDAMGNNSGVGNLYANNWAYQGCGKCSQHVGTVAGTDADPRLRTHYNAIVRDSLFTDCQQPIRTTSTGRYLIEYTRMEGFVETGLFRCLGPRFDGGLTGTSVIHMFGSELDGCDNGVRIGGYTEALVAGNTFTNNGFRGLRSFGHAKVSMWDNDIQFNGGIGSSEPGLGGVGVSETSEVDLGGGSLTIDGNLVSSPGLNTLCNNIAPNGSDRQVHNVTATQVKAENNYWCTMDPQSVVTGDIDTDPFLGSAP